MTSTSDPSSIASDAPVLSSASSASINTADVFVDERSTKLRLNAAVPTLYLVIENRSRAELRAEIRIDVLAPSGTVTAASSVKHALTPGRSSIEVPLPGLSIVSTSNDGRSEWYRVKYSLTRDGGPKWHPVQGTISVSEITPDLFALSSASTALVRPGRPFYIRVHSAHPINGEPQSGVAIEASLTFDDGDEDKPIQLDQNAVTDAEGYSLLKFDLPAKLTSEHAELVITGRRGAETSSVNASVRIYNGVSIYVSTDKPIYQPGQTLHCRFLAIDVSQRAVAGQKATLTILDPDRTTIMRVELITSEFGIAGTDWPIPAGERLGDYRIEVTPAGDDDSNWEGVQTVRLSRYDLPTFRVSVTPDRPYYCPGQNANVEVRAEYLFGKPVAAGHVKVVEEESRDWDYENQKWDIKEGAKYEGATNRYGVFVAKIDLSKQQKELAERDYSRFEDVTFSAYFTDSSTGKTEQRRFDLRVTRRPIHVYVIGPEGQAEGMPLRFYVSTYYADGTPAQCNVAIRLPEDSGDEKQSQSVPKRYELLASVTTNSYGLARVEAPPWPFDPDDDEGSLNLEAKDGHGLEGSLDQTFWTRDGLIRVESRITIHRPGQPLNVTFTANQDVAAAVVDVFRDWRLVASKMVRMTSRDGFATFPYQPDFKGKLRVFVYGYDSDGDQVWGSVGVVYPSSDVFKLAAHLSKAEYRPGENVTANLSVEPAANAALGVSVIDTAVEERARTDREFSRGAGFYGWLGKSFYGAQSISGVTIRDIETLDMSKPIPERLDLAAEILLFDSNPYMLDFNSSESYSDLRNLFASEIDPVIQPIGTALAKRFAKTLEYPTDYRTLDRLLSKDRIHFDKIRDPWGVPYRTDFSFDGASQVMTISSPGPDKQYHTSDDITAVVLRWPYFKRFGLAVDRAVAGYHSRTGGFIRDSDALVGELKRRRLDFNSLLDPWGHPYVLKFRVDKSNYVLDVVSHGPDWKGAASAHSEQGEILEWSSSIDYFKDIRERIDSALASRKAASEGVPDSLPEFQSLVQSVGIKLSDLHDPWGRAYYSTFRSTTRYGDRAVIKDTAVYGQKPVRRTEIQPVTQRIQFIDLRSAGPDGIKGTADDFSVAAFSAVVSEQSADQTGPAKPKTIVPLSPDSGGIAGTVTDPNGAVIANVSVSAKNSLTKDKYETKSGEDGKYALSNIPAGVYTVRFEAEAFTKAEFTEVRVLSSNVTTIDVSLHPGGVEEAVMVTSEAQPISTLESAEVSIVRESGITIVTKSGGPGSEKPGTAQVAIQTPRLRQYFPETLFWAPELDTDASGGSQVHFKLADNITTWKMSVIASTKDGRIALLDKNIRAFQPFFVEHEPPRDLTVGDEISLPVILRNYLDKSQSVRVEMKPESWFALKSQAIQTLNVDAGNSGRAVFDFTALTAIANGSQRVTAIGNDQSDAVEKPVTVTPDGRQLFHTDTQVFDQTAAFNVRIPGDAISGSTSVSLKLYPNLTSHILESVEAIMERPYGCAEQTISASYPSLMVLSLMKDNPEAPAPLTQKARRYLLMGYNRLLGYQSSSGGFTYWGRGEPDLALSAYALRFLNEASKYIEVDDDVITKTESWLERTQQKDGSWIVKDWQGRPDAMRSATTTAYIATVLARLNQHSQGSSSEVQTEAHGAVGTRKPESRARTATDESGKKSEKQLEKTLEKALAYLSVKIEEVDEPYAIASYALAEFDSGHSDRAWSSVARLMRLAHQEGSSAYWALETNTPFFGWGLPGRIEASALAVQALARADEAALPSPANGVQLPQQAQVHRLLNSGLVFLLKQKDRYGVWYSTQATLDVLDALVSQVRPQSKSEPGVTTGQVSKRTERDEVGPGSGRQKEDLDILVNGKKAGTIAASVSDFYENPIAIDLSKFVNTGDNRVELRWAGDHSKATAQLVASYYQPWSDFKSSESDRNSSRALELGVTFDKTRARVGDEITCTVKAERIGSRGYGMLIGEIGLPPGAEVDRDSLDRAIDHAGWSIDQYDILPDRLLVYLWPQGGGTTFQFKFRVRFGINAQAPASTVYDYYNPEAEAMQAPTRFVVSDR